MNLQVTGRKEWRALKPVCLVVLFFFFLKKEVTIRTSLQLKVTTEYMGIIEFIHLNPNKNIKAQRDTRGHSWSPAGEKRMLQSAQVSDVRTRLSFLSCTCQQAAALILAGALGLVLSSPLSCTKN